jgi:Zn-dependent metalloprotease
MARRPRKPATRKTASPAARKKLFETFSIHATDKAGRKIMPELKKERRNFRSFAAPGMQAADLDPESAAKRILMQTIESSRLPHISAPKVQGSASTFKSLGVETLALTGTTMVKFRQMIDNIPVYGSLVSVELDEKNEPVSINSNIAKPKVSSHTARVSQSEALKTVALAAGYSKAGDMPAVTPELHFYADSAGAWHLAFIFAGVVAAPGSHTKSNVAHAHFQPRFDYVIDALNGKLVAELPRTPSLTSATLRAIDELGITRRINVVRDAAGEKLIDLVLNIETYDFGFADPDVEGAKLPGKINASPPPFTPAAVSAHANAAEVAGFMRNVLKRNNIDNKGGKLVSVVNAVVKADSKDGKQWFNAFWDGKQMVYGQANYDGKLRSLAASLDVVAHEFFHGVTDHTAQLVYEMESGALNESYSDIFGTLISNFALQDMTGWNWLIGDGLSTGLVAFRSMKDPTLYDQPKHMRDYRKSANNANGDWGGVHVNSGIHNHAAYLLMMAGQRNRLIFTPAEVAAIFYLTITQQLSRQSSFADSRRGAVLSARSLFRKLPPAQMMRRVRAVERAFARVGIV